MSVPTAYQIGVWKRLRELVKFYIETLKANLSTQLFGIDYTQQNLEETHMDLLAIGTRIRSQREYLGYTREQLAEYLGSSEEASSSVKEFSGSSSLEFIAIRNVFRSCSA